MVCCLEIAIINECKVVNLPPLGRVVDYFSLLLIITYILVKMILLISNDVL